MSAIGAEALRYARDFGWHVFPINPQTKRPMFSRYDAEQPDHADCPEFQCGYKHATTDLDTIAGWWQRWPDAWLGVWCAASGLVVVDVDPRNGGTVPAGMPDTWVARTRSGGIHMYYRAPAGAEFPAGLGPGVDLKHNGYVLVAPSPRYRWLLSGRLAPWAGKTYKAQAAYTGPRAPEYDGPSDCSDAAVEYLRPYYDRLHDACELGAGRNNALYILARSAGQLVGGGEMRKAETLAWLGGVGPSLGLSRTRSTVRSGFQRGLTKDHPLTLTRTDGDGHTWARRPLRKASAA